MNVNIEDNLKFVRFIVNTYHSGLLSNAKRLGVSQEDIYQLGCVGLVEASKKYDPSKGKFTTYARYYISNEINEFFRDNNDIIKFSRYAKNIAKKIDEEDYHKLTVESIMEEYGCTKNIAEQTIAYIHSTNSNVKSLDAKIQEFNNSDAEVTLLDTISFNNDSELDKDFKIMFDSFLNTLSGRQKDVIDFKLMGLTNTEISKIIGVTAVTVRNDLKAIKKLMKAYQGGELCIL